MVRINLINPKYLADQHLIAEYAEILILLEKIRKHPKIYDLPEKYCLGTGHQKFFKNKVKYLKKRHQSLVKEMKKRGFCPRKTASLNRIPKKLINNWKPDKRDIPIIKKRLIQKLKLKSDFYRYYSKKKPLKFFISLVKKA